MNSGNVQRIVSLRSSRSWRSLDPASASPAAGDARRLAAICGRPGTAARSRAWRNALRFARHVDRDRPRALPSHPGTISHWHGSVFIRGVTLDGVLAGLTNPGTPPPQADVVASRVLARDASLGPRLHPPRPARHRHGHLRHRARDDVHASFADARATARSVATRIEEAGVAIAGSSGGCIPTGGTNSSLAAVLVELDSLTLSRSVPAIVRPVAMPLVNQVARESMTRTLEALQAVFEKSA